RPAPTSISTLSLHDALPIFPPVAVPRQPALPVGVPRHDRRSCMGGQSALNRRAAGGRRVGRTGGSPPDLVYTPLDLTSLFNGARSEEHTSELQSLAYLVCRL